MQRVYNKRSNEIVNGNPKLPTPAQLEYGELAINYAKGKETLSIKNDDDEIISLPFGNINGSSIKPLYPPEWFLQTSDDTQSGRPFKDLNEIYQFIRLAWRDNILLYEKESETDVRLAITSDLSETQQRKVYLFINNIPEYNSLIDIDRKENIGKGTTIPEPKKCVVRKHLPLNPNYMINYFFDKFPIMDVPLAENEICEFTWNRSDSKFQECYIIDQGFGGVDSRYYTLEDLSNESAYRYRLTARADSLFRVVFKPNYNGKTIMRNAIGTHCVTTTIEKWKKACKYGCI